jgi:hypothetical protein
MVSRLSGVGTLPTVDVALQETAVEHYVRWLRFGSSVLSTTNPIRNGIRRLESCSELMGSIGNEQRNYVYRSGRRPKPAETQRESQNGVRS